MAVQTQEVKRERERESSRGVGAPPEGVAHWDRLPFSGPAAPNGLGPVSLAGATVGHVFSSRRGTSFWTPGGVDADAEREIERKEKEGQRGKR